MKLHQLPSGAFYVRRRVHGKDAKIYLGTDSQRVADRMVGKVAELLDFLLAGQRPPAELLQWLADSPEGLRKSLETAGLEVDGVSRKQVGLTLHDWADSYVNAYQGNDRTIANYWQTVAWMKKHFSQEVLLSQVTAEDLIAWGRYLKVQGLAWSNRKKHVQRCRTIFLAAVRSKLITESPAVGLRIEGKENRQVDGKSRWVSPELAVNVQVKLPYPYDLIFVLLRWQGMRRHEVLSLKWEHIDWTQKSVAVPSKKRSRRCPLFVETAEALMPHKATSGYVIPWDDGDRDLADSLTPLLIKRIERIVGADNMWPNVCVALRSSRRTELEKRYPSHLLDRWMGHDYSTAQEHYLQQTEGDWIQAVADRTAKKASKTRAKK